MIGTGHRQLNLDHRFVLLLRLRQLEKEISPRSAYLPPPVFHPGSQCCITLMAVADAPDVYKGRHGLYSRQSTHSEQTLLGEFDRLWITDADQVDQFRRAFSGAPFVDARLVPAAGHCIDFHRQGTAFQLEQLRAIGQVSPETRQRLAADALNHPWLKPRSMTSPRVPVPEVTWSSTTRPLRQSLSIAIVR